MIGITVEEQRDLILSVGIHKQERTLSPIEVAQLLDKAIKAGTNIKELSGEILLDTTMITRFLRLLDISPNLRHLVGWGGKSSISFSTASEIARLEIVEDQEILGEAILKNQLSKTEVIRINETKKKFGKTIDDCVEDILNMRPRVVRRYLFIGAIRSSRLKERLDQMSQKERDIFFNNVLTIMLPGVSTAEGLLGNNRFTLIGNDDLEQALEGLSDDFSAVINDYLESNIK